MAILKVCAVYDAQLEAFNRPLYVPAVGMAVRSFSDEVKRTSPDNPLNAHPEDFNLFHIADWSEDDGSFECVVPPRLLVKGIDIA